MNAELRQTSGEVYQRVNQYEAETGKSLGRHQLAITKAPAADWAWLVGGKKGGLSEYAKLIGRAKSTVSECLSGAKVLNSVKCSDVRTVLDKANHLAAIHKAPDADWPWLVGHHPIAEVDQSLGQNQR